MGLVLHHKSGLPPPQSRGSKPSNFALQAYFLGHRIHLLPFLTLESFVSQLGYYLYLPTMPVSLEICTLPYMVATD